MSPTVHALIAGLIVLATVAAMEAVAALTHKYVMHGWGWGWHKSHHEQHEDHGFEKNDLYAVFFAAIAIALFWVGRDLWPVWYVAIGVTLYGALYFVMHDGLVHKRWPFNYIPRRGYLKRAYQAHRLHHAVEGRDGCVSFGFIYARPTERLLSDLDRNRARRQSRAEAAGPDGG